jgi:hypothetical protein
MYQRITGFLGLFFVVLSATAQTTTALAGMPRAWRLVHPNAVILLGVDVRAIRQSAAGKSLDKSLSQASGGMMSLPALQFLRDIDQVLLSAPGEKKLAPEAQAVKKPGVAANSPVLIILTGHFPAELTQSLLHGVHRTYNGVQIYASSPGSVNSEVALLNEHTLLFGDSDSLRGAIDRSQRSKLSPSPLLARAASLAPGNDLWLLATAPSSMFPPAGFQPAGVDLQAVASEIRGIEAGVAFRDGLKLAINLSTKDAESASRVVRSITAKLQSSMEGKVDARQAAEFLRKMHISAEGNQIRVKFAMSQGEMDRAVALAQKMHAASPTFALRPQPQRPEPGTIKVYGMPEGVREFSVESGKKE